MKISLAEVDAKRSAYASAPPGANPLGQKRKIEVILFQSEAINFI